MAITAQDVNKLRKMTGAGMMDCKKALSEANGDFDAAVDIIRKRGQVIASKRADREATEGAVIAKVSADKKFGAIIILNCETDFVATNAQFVDLANQICDLAIASQPADLEALKALQLGGVPVTEKVVELSGVIGEKMELSGYDCLKAETTVAYIHPGNKLATLVGLNQAGVDNQVAKDVAMQVAAMSPIAVDRKAVPQATIDHELEIGRDMARNEGKPEAMLDKIAQGRLNKFFKESTLMEQEFVKDSKINIGQYLEKASKGLVVTDFKRFSLNN